VRRPQHGDRDLVRQRQQATEHRRGRRSDRLTKLCAARRGF
jgi:hypothetical protein